VREVSRVTDEAQAQRLADYLLTLDISAKVLPATGGWAVWAQREDQVAEAKQESQAFLANPTDPRYRDAGRKADATRKEIAKRDQDHRKNTIELGRRLNAISARRCPVTYALFAVSVAVAILSAGGTLREVYAPLLFSTYEPVLILPSEPDANSEDVHVVVRSTGLEPIERGQIWRLFTPIFVHFGPVHLVFNMIWLYRLGGLVELRKGRLKTAGLVLLAALASNIGEYVWESYRYGPGHPASFGGMSGVVYALFGYVWMKDDYEPEADMHLPSNTIVYMIIWLIVCMTGYLGNIANAAHLVGLVVGMLVGLFPHLLADLARR
jgi:GlpG protein